MLQQFLILIFTGWIIQYVTMTHENVCREAFVKKEPCINGKRNVKITNYLRENGKCKPFPTTTSLHCESQRKEFCKCSAVDDLHYRTYDGQSIHFHGGCRYTLTQYKGGRDSCSFNIEVQNEYRGENKQFSHTKSVIIHMFGDKFELGQKHTLKIGNIERSIPYEKNENIRIFRSHNFVQFVAPACSVHVAFDGKSNAFVEVSKKYSRKMIGICGDCNGKQDDFRTKFGKDVSKEKNKYSLIGNSYSVIDPGHYCKPAEHIMYENVCDRNFIEKAKASNLCGAILASNNPFSRCGKQGYVDLRNFYEDCLINICIKKNKPENHKSVQCKILEGLAETCAEAGVPGIKWRINFNCVKKCGENQHFTEKASPCPRTCENHFFGTKRPCYDLPEREGCECNKGYIRDGALCVKPMHCKCMSLCTDRKSSDSCRKWKSRGDCEKFAEPMNILCPKTCGFCKQRNIQCENEISSKRCLKFRQQGLCFQEFYRSICGLTCNYDKCRCDDDQTIVGTCNKNTKLITTTHYSFTRDSKGRCAKIVRQTHEACPCDNDWTEYGICNFCTGKRNVTNHIYDVINMKCVRRSNTRYENCQRCSENARTETECLSDKYLRTTVSFNRLNGCFQCIPDRKISTTEIKCKTTTVDKINGCWKHSIITNRKPLNCRCHQSISSKINRICCKKPIIVKECENRKFIHKTISYKLVNGLCIPQYSYIIETPACQSTKLVKRGNCEPKRNGLFYCQATDTQEIVEIGKNCKCVKKVLKRSRTCCCKPSQQYRECNKKLGIITSVKIIYNMVKRGKQFECVKREDKSFTFVNSQTQIFTKVGICKSNCKRTDIIMKTYRDGCKIKTAFSKNDDNICCCYPHKSTKTECIFNSRVIKEFDRIVINNKCFDVLKSRKEIPINCPDSTKSESKCVNRRRTITIKSYYVKNCQCELITKTEIKSCSCAYKVISEKTLPCKSTCKTFHVTFFRDSNCNNAQLVCPVECCCLNHGTKRTECNTITGQIITSTETFYFDKSKSKCLSKKSTSAKLLKCNQVKTIVQKCGEERQNYKKITTIKETLSEQTCSCKQSKNVVWKCCKLPERFVKRECRGDYFHIEILNYKFAKDRIKCISETIIEVKKIQCPLIKNPSIKYISKCKYKQSTFYYRIENCVCKLHKNSVILHKCCEKPKKLVQCSDGSKKVTTITTFKLSTDRKQCLSYLDKISQLITCQSYKRSSNTVCKNREYHEIKEYFQVKNCECRKFKTEKVKKLCRCKKPSVNVSCLGKKIRTTTTTYTLINNEKCIAKINTVEKTIKCADPYAVVCPCNKRTNLKSITRFYYETINCKCEFRKSYIPCKCSKIPNDIRLGPCKANNMRTVEVYRYVLIGHSCEEKLFTSYQDICKCSKDESNTICFRDSIVRTTIIKYQLLKIASQFPTHQCMKSHIIKHKTVVCNRDYKYNGPCINNLQQEIQCTFRSINCKCEMSCKSIKVSGCDCGKLDHREIKCLKNVKYFIYHKYKPGRSKCEPSKSKIRIDEQCSTERRTKCMKLNVRKNHCVYNLCTTTFYVYRDCRCSRHIENTETCIRCQEPITRVQCINNRRVFKTINFIKRKNECIKDETDIILTINCPKWKISKIERHGLMEYKLTYYIIKNCKCMRKVIIRSYPPCSFRKLKSQCINNQQIYTYIEYRPQFTQQKLFPEVDSSLLKQICVEISTIRIEPINCPRSFTIITCDTARNVKTERKYYYIVENCLCIKKKNTINTYPCESCHKPIISESACGPINQDGIGYITVTTKFWNITRKNTCEPHVKISRKIGCCRKNQIIRECKNGHKIFKTLQYDVIAHCKPRTTIISESMPCYNHGRPNKWRIVKIVKCQRVGEFSVEYLERMNFDPTTCHCKRISKSVRTDICCKPCQYRTECRHNNNIINIAICQRSENLKCVYYRKEKFEIKYCPNPKEETIGDCQGSIIQNRVTTYKSINCMCVKKVKEYTQFKVKDRIECYMNLWKTTHIGYELVHHKCVAKHPMITYRKITCSSVKTFKDKKINECDFSRSYFVKTVSNCQCVDKLVKKEILHFKCCQRPIISEICFENKIKILFKTNYNLVHFKCYPVRSEIRIPIDCSHLKLQDRITTGKCEFKLMKYSVAYRNCKCHRILKTVETNLKTCCPKPDTQQRCDAVSGRILTINTTFKLEGYKCNEIKRTISTPINCDSKICEKIYTKCIHNTQTIQLFCLKRQGCQCVKQKVSQHNVCCGSNKDSTWTIRRLCDGHRKYYKLIQTYALKLHYITNICKRVVINQQYKICRCPDSYNIESCINDINIKKISISYKINILKNACDQILKDSISLIPRCHKSLKIKISEKETYPDGWCENTYLTTYPKNCKCLETVTKEKVRCPCYKDVSVQKYKHCKNNNVIVLETRTPKCILKNVKWIIENQNFPILNCAHKQILRGQSFSVYRGYVLKSRYDVRNGYQVMKYAVRCRYDTHLQWFVENCICKTRTTWEGIVCIECIPPHQEEECLVSKKIITSYRYAVINGICKRFIDKKEINIPCPHRPEIKQSKCINNLYIVTTTNYFYMNCRCESRVEKKTCHCKCPQNSIIRKCSGNYLLNEITTKYRKEDCICYKNEIIKQIEPECPKFFPQTVGNCPHEKGRPSYQKIITRHLRQNRRTCKCEVEPIIRNKICDCLLPQEKRQICIRNNLIFETLGWRINEIKNKCDKILINSITKVIICPQQVVRKFCDYKIGKGKETTVKYKLENCECIRQEIVKSINCPCNTTAILERIGICPGYPNCLRFDNYNRKEIRGNKCVPVKEKRKVICCCKPERKIKFCKYNKFINLRVKNSLKNGLCRKEINKIITLVNCSKDEVVKESKCGIYGYKILNYYRKNVRNCTCKQEKIKIQICKCRCAKGRIQKKCHSSGKILITTHTTYINSNCRCIKRKTTRSQHIHCPKDSTEISTCFKKINTNYYVKTIKIKHYLLKKCKCRLSKKITEKICWCDKLKYSSVTCDKKSQTEITKDSELIFKDAKCVYETHITKKPITCNNKWKLINKPVCHPHELYGTEIRIYEKLLFKNCGCKLLTKKETCNCKCTGPTMSEKCEGHVIHKYYYEYKLGRCKCQKNIVSEETETIHCDKKPPKVGKCVTEKNHCVRYTEYRDSVISNCKCYEKRRIVREICKSCCDVLSTTEKTCDKLSNNIITKIINCYVSNHGRIRRSVQIKKHGISCDVGKVCKSKTNCHPTLFTESLECTTTFVKDCTCKSKTESFKGDCICGPDNKIFGKCNPHSCKREVILIKHKLVILINNNKTCQEEKVKVNDELCCCPKSTSQEQCNDNKLIRTTETYTFSEEKKTCDVDSHKDDVTPACGSAIEKISGRCNQKTCKISIKLISRSMENCKCKIAEETQTNDCCCPEDKTKKKCIENQWEIFSYKYMINKTDEKCVEAVTKDIKTVECPETKTEFLNYDISTKQDVYRETTYKKKNCECIPTITIIYKCPICPQNTAAEKCISDKGILRSIITTNTLDEQVGKCIVKIKQEDKQIKCLETPKYDISNATHSYDNGWYNVITTHYEKRKDCECIKESSVRYELHKCNSNINTPDCKDNKNIIRKTIYTTKTGDNLYNYKCERKEETVDGAAINCPSNSSITIDKEKGLYNVTYYTIQNCDCVANSENVVKKCSEGCIVTYCTEESTLCSIESCTIDFKRSNCPITCGFCVKCEGDISVCEKNPYDDKYYKKKDT